jgi:hypothetical protein
MSGNGAYGGEMNDVALFESALRAAVPTQPDPRIGGDLVPRLAGIARTVTLVAAEEPPAASTTYVPRRRSRRGLVARVGIAVAAIPLLFAGLAVAGVTVPEPARDAFEAAGVELPNQGSDDAPKGGTKDGAPGTSEAPGAPASGDLPSEASPKAKDKVQGNADGDKPGRRVRRHGEGPVPGPASPPEGRALGNGNHASGSSANSDKGGGSANAGGSRSNRGASARGQARGLAK